jgi:hypothetical protein
MNYMKKNALYFFAALLFLAGCEKNSYNITDRQGIEGKSMVKVGLFSMTPVANNVLIYVNGERISGVLAAPYPYPGGGFNTGGSSNGDYFALNPGPNRFQLYTTNPGTANTIAKIFDTTLTLAVNNRQTVYIADTAANTVAVLAPDNAVAPDSGFARIRFINLIPNSGSVDFYKGTSLLKSNVKYKEFTDFFDVPASVADSFSIRPTGTPAGPALTATAYYRLATNTNRRIYSFVSRGYIGATGLRIPAISVSVNQ